MATLITSGVDYSRFFDDLRTVVRQEVTQAITAEKARQIAPEVGGLEVATDVTGLSDASIYRLVSERAIPHSKKGNRLYFNRADLLEWVAQGRRGVTS